MKHAVRAFEPEQAPGDGDVRDSKNPAGPALVFTPAGFAAFIAGVKHSALATPHH